MPTSPRSTRIRTSICNYVRVNSRVRVSQSSISLRLSDRFPNLLGSSRSTTLLTRCGCLTHPGTRSMNSPGSRSSRPRGTLKGLGWPMIRRSRTRKYLTSEVRASHRRTGASKWTKSKFKSSQSHTRIRLIWDSNLRRRRVSSMRRMCSVRGLARGV